MTPSFHSSFNIKKMGKEFNLNIKHQKIQSKEFMSVCYKWDDEIIVCGIMLPLKFKNMIGE